MSSDRDEATFGSYFGSMPAGFLAVPWSDRARKEQLNQRFRVSGIPSVILVKIAKAQSPHNGVDSGGGGDDSDKSSILSTDGRAIISGDPSAEVSLWQSWLAASTGSHRSRRLLTPSRPCRLHPPPPLPPSLPHLPSSPRVTHPWLGFSCARVCLLCALAHVGQTKPNPPASFLKLRPAAAELPVGGHSAAAEPRLHGSEPHRRYTRACFVGRTQLARGKGGGTRSIRGRGSCMA